MLSFCSCKTLVRLKLDQPDEIDSEFVFKEVRPSGRTIVVILERPLGPEASGPKARQSETVNVGAKAPTSEF